MNMSRIRIHKRAAGTLAYCCVLLLAIMGLSCGGSDQSPIRIVLITVDTLRYDSFMGSDDRPGSMIITHALAERGSIFTHHYAATSTTQPTHATIFTGLHPWQNGIIRNGIVLADDVSTVTEQLKASGFNTGAVVASFPVSRKFGFGQGFDYYDDDFTVPYTPTWNGRKIPGARFYSLADEITAKALAMLDRVRGPKQFYWFHYFDPHEPYGDTSLDAPIRLNSLLRTVIHNNKSAPAHLEQAHQYYDRDVEFLDRSLERIFRRLRMDADTIETHVIVTADHGESFGENGALAHGKRITNEQIHVPLFILSPRVHPGVREEPTGSIDIPARILSLAGLANNTSGGRDLTQESLKKSMVFGMRRVFAKPTQELRTDGKFHILDNFKFYAATHHGVYRGDHSGITADDSGPVEKDIATELKELFHTFELKIEGNASKELVDPETQKALEALGYVR